MNKDFPFWKILKWLNIEYEEEFVKLINNKRNL